MNQTIHNLRVVAYPLPIKWADKSANFEAVENVLANLPQSTDILVLPELFSTGYSDDASILRELAEKNTGTTIDLIKDWASRYNIAIAGSFLAYTHPNLYNRGFFIEPDGEETFYDKRHLFSLSSESKIFKPGNDPIKIVRFRGWNIALVICYDLRFPVWCRSYTTRYDLLLIPANWPEARAYAWEHLLIARAIENQCCIVGANRGGEDVYGSYKNLSYIFDGRGMPVGIRPKNSDIVVADLNKAEQEKYRYNFPVLNDSDDFKLLP